MARLKDVWPDEMLLAEIATTFVSPVGTLVPLPLPHATTVPLVFKARPCEKPAAMAVTPDSPAGTFVPAPAPQAVTVPSLRNASE